MEVTSHASAIGIWLFHFHSPIFFKLLLSTDLIIFVVVLQPFFMFNLNQFACDVTFSNGELSCITLLNNIELQLFNDFRLIRV